MNNILSIIQTICLNYKLLEFYDLFNTYVPFYALYVSLYDRLP
jgi:hypothetical protein